MYPEIYFVLPFRSSLKNYIAKSNYFCLSDFLFLQFTSELHLSVLLTIYGIPYRSFTIVILPLCNIPRVCRIDEWKRRTVVYSFGAESSSKRLHKMTSENIILKNDQTMSNTLVLQTFGLKLESLYIYKNDGSQSSIIYKTCVSSLSLP